jgi:hypothetical protein
VLRRNVLGDWTGILSDVDGGSCCEWSEGYEDIVAEIYLKSGFGHVVGSSERTIVLERISLMARWMNSSRVSSGVRRNCGERMLL